MLPRPLAASGESTAPVGSQFFAVQILPLQRGLRRKGGGAGRGQALALPGVRLSPGRFVAFQRQGGGKFSCASGGRNYGSGPFPHARLAQW